MEELENFYLLVLASLRELQTLRMEKEKLMPIRYDVHFKKAETRKARRLAKNNEKLRLKIEKGYYKGLNDSINEIESLYKKVMKACQKQKS